MGKPLDLKGQKFGRLLVVEKSEQRGKNGDVFWICQCDCGKQVNSRAQTLRSGRSLSCGCYAKDQKTTHGKSYDRIYRIWTGMLQRCNNPKQTGYELYGGAGIKVCERWHTFENFYADMGDPPTNTSLDRIDNRKGYEPGNCRWATPTTQSLNRSVAIVVEYENEQHYLARLADAFLLRRPTLRERIKRGWNLDEALKTDVQIHEKLSDPDAKLAKELHERGIGLRKIGKIIGRDHNVVRNGIIRFGGQIRGRNLLTDDEVIMAHNLHKRGLSLCAIGRAINRSHHAVKRALQKIPKGPLSHPN